MSRSVVSKVRFAPSPTGNLHIGGVRTALFNWLHARGQKGKFVLRIEDTDVARSTQESSNNLLETMRWLGLDWDEGPEIGGPNEPYYQAQRLPIYKKYVDQLVDEGKAYRCYSTREELDALRAALPEKERARFVYPHIWRDRDPAEFPADQPYVIRFKSPLTGETTFEDMVFGKITTPNNTLQDFVIMRGDGMPLYNFGAVVDDLLMGMTLVARGGDHVANTVQQVLLYEALGAPLPEFAHLPLILSPDRRKMSKRDGERLGLPVSVTEFRERGFSPLGLMVYLMRFGWSHGDQELFSREELIEKFRMDQVTSSDGVFDYKKCVAINKMIIQSDDYTTLETYLLHLMPFLEAHGFDTSNTEYLTKVVGLVRPRASTFVEAADALDFFFNKDVVYDPKAEGEVTKPGANEMMLGLSEELAKVSVLGLFDVETIHNTLDGFVTAHDLKWKDFGPTIRVALAGRKGTPGLPEMIEALGFERVQARLSAAQAHTGPAA